MNTLVRASIALALTGLPAGAAGQSVTQSYQYDANGRLTGVTTTGAAGTNTAAYVYDDADNRTSRSQTGTAYAELRLLPADGALRPDQALVSADGRYSFALRPSGKLELWTDDLARSPASEAMAAAFLVGADGQVRFRPPGLAPERLVGADLVLGDDGEVVLRDRVDGTARWRTATIQTAGDDQ